jgi:hypothetical protein
MSDIERSLKDIGEIRALMERSTKFLSLSGLSGLSAGIVALVGAGAAGWYQASLAGRSPIAGLSEVRDARVETFFVLDAAIVFVVAVSVALFFSSRRARKQGLEIWTPAARLLLREIAVPLLTGGILCMIMIADQKFFFLPGLSLIFYGLAIVNICRLTLHGLEVLGLAEIVLGLVAVLFVEYGLLLWGAGFGLLHIIYGTSIYWTHERQSGGQSIP